VAGRVPENMVVVDGHELQMIINANEALGNCPKVIPSADDPNILVHYHQGH
jgi:hypothetical protein